jgi:hypothetical protein
VLSQYVTHGRLGELVNCQLSVRRDIIGVVECMKKKALGRRITGDTESLQSCKKKQRSDGVILGDEVMGCWAEVNRVGASSQPNAGKSKRESACGYQRAKSHGLDEIIGRFELFLAPRRRRSFVRVSVDSLQLSVISRQVAFSAQADRQ